MPQLKPQKGVYIPSPSMGPSFGLSLSWTTGLKQERQNVSQIKRTIHPLILVTFLILEGRNIQVKYFPNED